jgi:hypothetical protein
MGITVILQRDHDWSSVSFVGGFIVDDFADGFAYYAERDVGDQCPAMCYLDAMLADTTIPLSDTTPSHGQVTRNIKILTL